MNFVAERLGEYIASVRYEDLPSHVVIHGKLCLLDALGVAATGINKPWCRAVHELVRSQAGAEEASVWYQEERVPDTQAALANAIAVHSMDFNDDLAGVQVSGLIMPTALAVAESTRASGREAVIAIIIGYDIATRCAMAMNSQGLYLRGLQPTAVCGAIGAAAVAARLLQLEPMPIADAFGIAASYAGGTIEFLKEGTDTKRFHVAKAAHGGVLAARLAANGMTGPHSIFEGEAGILRAYSDGGEPDRLLEELGTRFDILDTSVKRYPFCDGNAAPLEAALEILHENGRAVDDVAAFHFRIKSFLVPYVVNYYGDKERKYRPRNELDAQMSLPYCLAVGLRRGGCVMPADFDREVLSDPVTLELADKVTAEADEELDKIPLKPMSMPAIATLRMKDGQVFEKRVDYQKGDPRNPFNTDDFISKFRQCTDGVVRAEQQDRVVEEVLEIDSAEHIAELMAYLRR